jgi:hypothetical protein
MQTVKDMGTPKIIANSNWDASNVQMTTWQTSTTKKQDLVMSDISSVVEVILRITRDVPSTKTYKRKHTHLSGWYNTLLSHKSNIHHTLDQE